MWVPCDEHAAYKPRHMLAGHHLTSQVGRECVILWRKSRSAWIIQGPSGSELLSRHRDLTIPGLRCRWERPRHGLQVITPSESPPQQVTVGNWRRCGLQ